MRVIDDNNNGGEYIPPTVFPVNNNYNQTTDPPSFLQTVMSVNTDNGGGSNGNPVVGFNLTQLGNDANMGGGYNDNGGGAPVRNPTDPVVDVVPVIYHPLSPAGTPATSTVAPVTNTNPVTSLTGAVSNVTDQIKAAATANPLLVYGGVALVIYLLMKKK